MLHVHLMYQTGQPQHVVKVCIVEPVQSGVHVANAHKGIAKVPHKLISRSGAPERSLNCAVVHADSGPSSR